MRSIKILRMTKKVIVILFVSMAMMSCDRSDGMRSGQITQKCESRVEGNGAFLKYKEIFRSHIVATNMTLSGSYRKTSEICKNILKIRNKQESFKLLDQFLEMAIAHEVTATEYNLRQCRYDMLWYIAKCTFIGAQKKNGNDYEYWDKMFRFFAKYTNEIAAVERTLPRTNCAKWGIRTIWRGEYLFGIKGDLKTWVRVIRDFHYPNLTKDFTEEQKADIMRRFKEVEKYTVTPPHYPGGRNVTKEEK